MFSVMINWFIHIYIKKKDFKKARKIMFLGLTLDNPKYKFYE